MPAMLQEQPEEENLEEAGSHEEQEEEGAGTPHLLQSQGTLKKAVTKKMSTKGRCRVLTIVESIVDESVAEVNPLAKVASVPVRRGGGALEAEKPLDPG